LSAPRTLPPRLILALALAAYAALAFGYITLTPIWQNPDEPAHYAYVAFVAETGGLPELRPGDWDSALLDRLKNGHLGPGDAVGAIRYEAWQPPLFYLAAAPALRLVSNFAAADPAATVSSLRAFNALIGALTLVVAYFSARTVLAAHLALAVPLAMVGVPMFTAVSAAISADPLANLLSAGVLLLLLRRVRRRRSEFGNRWGIGAGALIGLGLLTKLALAIFVPLALVVIVFCSSHRVREGALLLATTGLLVLPWLVHQVTTYGWTDPLATTRHAQVVLDQQRFPGLSLEYLGAFFTTSFHSFWAQFGWMAVVAPARLYWIWGVLTLAALAGLVLQRSRLAEPEWRLVVLTVVAAAVGYVGYNLAFVQFQGRYLFTALVPLVMLLVAGWAGCLPRRVQAWGVLLIGCGLVALNAYALLRVLVPGFALVG
jgi:4-amino-4-deoxy-L-arabinose transferase-like glycosyltransferase